MAFGFALLCVLLTAVAQVLLKMGMTALGMQQALSDGMSSVYRLALTSPLIWGGMLCFGFSAGLWLLVLSKLEVSIAYPLTSLGIVLTMAAGVFLLGESVSTFKLVGAGLIVTGVLILAAGN